VNIIVIGAGLSGLTAARVLRDAGADVLLIEAGVQIGGRIRALYEPKTNEYLADLGPTWVWPKYQPVVTKWAKTLGIETFEQFNDGDAVILGYGPAPLRQPLPGQDGMVRIVGGPTALTDALSNEMDATNIRTSTPVSGIYEDGSKRVSVYLRSGEILTAENVIVSTPLRVAALRLEMPWALSALLDAMRGTTTWMSTHAKAVARYDRPFWRDAGLAGRIASRTGPLVEAHDHSGPDGATAAIFGFVGWSPDVRQRDQDELKRAILKQLTECFGPEAANPMDLVVQDWATNPNIVTDLDLYARANHPGVGPAVLRQAHLGGRVRFAVSETSEISPGLIEGAIAAGERAAKDVLAHISH
jgi:monoamine oxidase